MDPLTMALIASAVSAGLPYVVQGVKEGFGATPFGSITSGEREELRESVSREQARMMELQEEERKLREGQIATAKAAGGRATGAALAAGAGSNILGFNPLVGAQARQAEMQTMAAIRGIQVDALRAKQEAEAQRRQAAEQTGAGIIASTSAGTARRSRLNAMADAYGSGPEADRLRAMAALA